MSIPPVTLWATPNYSCVLRQTDGRLEVLLCHDGRTIRLNTSDDERAARAVAYQWKVALVPSEH